MRVIVGAGSGKLPTVVLLHGLGSQGADYLPLLARLRPHVRKTVAPDMPGHGASEAEVALRPRRTHVETLGEALDEVLDEPAVIFGNSLGGYAALRYAIARPERVRGLFLASPSGAPSTKAEIDRLIGVLRIRSHSDALRFLELAVHGEGGWFRHVMAWGLRRRFNAASLKPWIDSIGDAESLAPDDLARMTMPIHLVWGRSERLLPKAHLEFFRAHLPKTACIDEPHGFAHSPQLDDPNELARRLLAFAEVA
ncbi:MAG TPA: alpha/beta hydrolase [Polyangiaceae bacterium]|nr:alpha/beta hydrolase [Polyangiaceae bacterium]